MCKSSWIIHRIRERQTDTEEKRECVKFVHTVRVSVRYQLSRRVAGSPSGSNGSGFSPLFTPWLPSVQTIPTPQFSNSATTGIGENSPTMYALQGSSLNLWKHGWIFNQVIWHVKSVCFLLLFKVFIFHKCTQSSASTRWEKKSCQSHEISFL